MRQTTPITTIKPPALKIGDTIGIVAPSSSVKRDMLAAGCRELEGLGFKVRCRDDIHSEYRYLAGGVVRRVEEFREMLEDPGVAAIFCARGGYGSGHLLEHLSGDEILRNPKILCGASDITMLLNAFMKAGVVGFHGPMVATAFNQGPEAYDRDLLVRMLVDGEEICFQTLGTRILCEGEAEGRLLGGCLSLLVSTLGTDWEIDTTDSLLFVEDVDVKPYQIDRMLTHLKQAGKLDGIGGLIFGEMLGCLQHPNQGYQLEELVRDFFVGSGVPVLFGLPSGHTSKPSVILPFGVRARLALGETTVFEMLEPAVETA